MKKLKLLILALVSIACALTNDCDQLIGGYGFAKDGKANLYIQKVGNDFYLKFPGGPKALMSKVSPENCSRILGPQWQSILECGLHSGAFFIFKVKKGSVIQGRTINSGFFGAVPAAGEIWKVE